MEIKGNKSTISELAEQRNKQGGHIPREGVWKIVEVGNSFKVSLKRMERDAREKADELVKNMGGAQYGRHFLDKVGAAFWVIRTGQTNHCRSRLYATTCAKKRRRQRKCD